jgi:hypothetical protein
VAVKKKEPLRLTRDDLPEALHVALRKCCDSEPTSMLWNLIYIMDSSMWEKYLDHVFMKVKIAEETGTPYWEAIKAASKGFSNEIYKTRDPKIEGHCLTLMDMCFREFSELDWKGYAEYITEY